MVPSEAKLTIAERAISLCRTRQKREQGVDRQRFRTRTRLRAPFTRRSSRSCSASSRRRGVIGPLVEVPLLIGLVHVALRVGGATSRTTPRAPRAGGPRRGRARGQLRGPLPVHLQALAVDLTRDRGAAPGHPLGGESPPGARCSPWRSRSCGRARRRPSPHATPHHEGSAAVMTTGGSGSAAGPVRTTNQSRNA